MTLEVFHLCKYCNEESQVPLDENLSGFYSGFYSCPHCNKRNDIWIRVLVKHETN